MERTSETFSDNVRNLAEVRATRVGRMFPRTRKAAKKPSEVVAVKSEALRVAFEIKGEGTRIEIVSADCVIIVNVTGTK